MVICKWGPEEPLREIDVRDQHRHDPHLEDGARDVQALLLLANDEHGLTATLPNGADILVAHTDPLVVLRLEDLAVWAIHIDAAKISPCILNLRVVLSEVGRWHESRIAPFRWCAGRNQEVRLLPVVMHRSLHVTDRRRRSCGLSRR